MDDREIDNLISSEREWRKYLTRKIDSIEERLASHMAWNLVFRLGGGVLFGVLVIWIEGKVQ